MDLSALRERLIEQHRLLRERIQALIAASQKLTADDVRAELSFRVALVELSDGLARHNREEERLLSAVLPTIDAWGPARRCLMDEHHAGEHMAQLNVLRSMVDCKPLAMAIDQVQRHLRDVLDHMGREELDLLHPDVLRDDCYAIDADAE